jgi:hypothetical protein
MPPYAASGIGRFSLRLLLACVWWGLFFRTLILSLSVIHLIAPSASSSQPLCLSPYAKRSFFFSRELRRDRPHIKSNVTSSDPVSVNFSSSVQLMEKSPSLSSTNPEKPHDGSSELSTFSESSAPIDPTLERVVWRKMDMWLLPVVAMFYFLSFLVSRAHCVKFRAGPHRYP